jgi:hypothetical protein
MRLPMQGESRRRVVFAFIATAFAQDDAEAAKAALAQSRRPAAAFDPKTRQAHERGRAGYARIHELFDLASGPSCTPPIPSKRLHGEIMRRTEVIGIFPSHPARIKRRMSVQRVRYMTLETIAPISDNPIVGLRAVATRQTRPWPAIVVAIQKLHHRDTIIGSSAANCLTTHSFLTSIRRQKCVRQITSTSCCTKYLSLHIFFRGSKC